MKVMVTGAAGMLGHALVPELRARGHDVLALDLAQADVTDAAALGRYANSFGPAWVAHLAAFTDVDRCESEQARALLVNGTGTRNAARVAADVGAAVLALSTDYVFDGRATTPRREDDATEPVTAYGRSKLAGEHAAREANPHHLVVRTAWLYGAGGRNFVDTILARARAGEPLRVVDDQRGSPTMSADLAAALATLMDSGERGTFHVTNSGECTWHDLAVAACEDAGIRAEVGRLSTAELARPARRPAYSVLDTERYTLAAGAAMPGWRDALRRYLAAKDAIQGGVR
jgi:dTDP-4-dehydrorhamnose reductase